MNAYKKEVWITVALFLVYMLSGHMGFIFSLFPVEGNFMGFPTMYIVPILVGWLGVLVLTIVSKYLGNYIDDQIELENQSLSSDDVSKREAV